MKKLLCLTVLTLGFNALHAQGFYLKLHGGYSGTGIQNNATLMAPRVDAAHAAEDGLVAMASFDDSAHTYRQTHYSYAAGGNISLGVGYMVNHWFGVEVDAHYLWNGSATSTLRSDLGAIGLTGKYIDADIKTYSKNGLSITPMLVFVAAKKEWKVQPYAKIGIVVPVYGKVVHELEITSPVSLPFDPYFIGNRTSVVMNTASTFSVGFAGTVGIRYSPIPFITLFADLNVQWLNIRAKKTTITKWEAYDAASGKTYDMIHPDPAVPNAPVRSTYRTEFEYVDQLDANSNNATYNTSYDNNKPKQDARITAPAGNAGFQLGIQFNFGKSALASLHRKG